MYRFISVIIIAGSLAACGITQAQLVTDAGDAVTCAASIGAAWALNPVSIVTSGLAGCSGLTADVIAQLEAKAKPAAMAQRRAMGR